MLDKDFNLEFSKYGVLYLHQEDGKERVTIRKCFPWSQAEQFFSLQNDEGEELALIERVSDLNGESLKALVQGLVAASFSFEVLKVYSVELDFELRIWDVDTTQGRRTFQTKPMDWPRELSGGGLLIQAIDGDLYRIADVSQLDEASQKQLWSFK